MAEDGDEQNQGPGQPRVYTEEDFISAVRSIDGSVTTAKVADEVGCSHDLAWQRLSELTEKAMLVSEKVGNARVWSLTDDEK